MNSKSTAQTSLKGSTSEFATQPPHQLMIWFVHEPTVSKGDLEQRRQGVLRPQRVRNCAFCDENFIATKRHIGLQPYPMFCGLFRPVCRGFVPSIYPTIRAGDFDWPEGHGAV